ncbi:MAG TPA: SCO family protein [Longimicrobiaceae bacterium]|nr:SCO family protein [Longimicrobiaceae bacterium]
MQTSDRQTRSPLRGIGILLALAALPVLGAAGYFALAAKPAFHGTTYEEVTPAPGFTLVDHTGRKVALSDFRGEAVLLFFGFTHCPDVCPLTLGKLARVTESLGRRGEEVRILLVTVDPERDTPAALAEYVRRFTPRALGLTGDRTALEQAYRGYGVYTLPGSGHGQPHAGGNHHPNGMTHSTAVYGIDRQGRLQVVIPPGAPEEQIRDDVRTLLSR